MSKSTIVGFMSAFAVLSIAISLPVWWFSSGRDMRTFHDGLSTQFRASVIRILAADGYQARKPLYDQSRTITDRDNLIKYGERPLEIYSKGELQKYIGWQGRIESEKEWFDKFIKFDNEIIESDKKIFKDTWVFLADRKILIQDKQILTRDKKRLIQDKTRSIENMKALHSMSEMCRAAVVNMLWDITITSDSRCKLELTPN
jgi:hypothetical protein